MSGIQGIIVCGEASESDEEEEFCIVQAQGYHASESKRNIHLVKRIGKRILKRNSIHFRISSSRGETNTSLEKNLCKALQEPLVKKTSHMATLITSIPAAQTSTLSANAAFSNVTLNLSHIDLLLQGLSHINAFDTLKSPPSCSS